MLREMYKRIMKTKENKGQIMSKSILSEERVKKEKELDIPKRSCYLFFSDDVIFDANDGLYVIEHMTDLKIKVTANCYKSNHHTVAVMVSKSGMGSRFYNNGVSGKKVDLREFIAESATSFMEDRDLC